MKIISKLLSVIVLCSIIISCIDSEECVTEYVQNTSFESFYFIKHFDAYQSHATFIERNKTEIVTQLQCEEGGVTFDYSTYDSVSIVSADGRNLKIYKSTDKDTEKTVYNIFYWTIERVNKVTTYTFEITNSDIE